MDTNEESFNQIVALMRGLKAKGLKQTEIEWLLQAAIKDSREQRYFGRGPDLEAQIWEPVLRTGYEQYVVSDWGYVRHKNKSTVLRPAFEHSYARAPMKAPNRSSGGQQQMIHELVYESFVLGQTLESKGIKKGYEVIHHKDEDKWNPALDNLEPVSQSDNVLYSHKARAIRSRT